MNRIFSCQRQAFFTVPDGTQVNPFLNPMDLSSELGHNIPDGCGLTVGRIPAHHESDIHVLPLVTQVTALLQGCLEIVMQTPNIDLAPYVLSLETELGELPSAAVTKPGTFLQLCNRSDNDVVVLYMTTPAFVYEPGATGPIYDDAITLGKEWETLDWEPPNREHLQRQRNAAIQRIRGTAASAT